MINQGNMRNWYETSGDLITNKVEVNTNVFRMRVDGEDQSNTERDHANDLLVVSSGFITRARIKRFKTTLNGLVHSTWSKMKLERQMTPIELKRSPLIH